jgi:hypothetical protein
VLTRAETKTRRPLCETCLPGLRASSGRSKNFHDILRFTGLQELLNITLVCKTQ